MIDTVKRKSKRAKKIAEKNNFSKPVIFRRQLHKLYTAKPLKETKFRTRHKYLVKKENGEFALKTVLKTKELRSNYFTYMRRASDIMNDDSIINQLRNHKRIFNEAINKHLKQ